MSIKLLPGSKEIVQLYKEKGLRPPTILLVPGLPRVEGKNAIYQDGTVRSLNEVLPSPLKNAGLNRQKFRQVADRP